MFPIVTRQWQNSTSYTLPIFWSSRKEQQSLLQISQPKSPVSHGLFLGPTLTANGNGHCGSVDGRRPWTCTPSPEPEQVPTSHTTTSLINIYRKTQWGDNQPPTQKRALNRHWSARILISDFLASRIVRNKLLFKPPYP